MYKKLFFVCVCAAVLSFSHIDKSLAANLDVTIEQKSGQIENAPINSSVKFIATFSSPINKNSFTASDLDFSLSTASGITVSSITEITPMDGTTFEVSVSATSSGTIIMNMAAGNATTTTASFSTTGATPIGIAVDSHRNAYVLNYASTSVSKITPNGVVSHFANTGRSPSSIVIDSNDNLYIANEGDNTITKIITATSSPVVSIFASTGLNGSKNMALDSDNNLYVTNINNHTFSKFDPQGNLVGNFFTQGNGSYDIVIDRNNRIYISNLYGQSVYSFNLDGSHVGFFNTETYPLNLAVDSNNNIYLTRHESGRISKFNGSGFPNFTFVGPDPISAFTGLRPTKMAIDKMGNIYTANINTNNPVSKITPQGVVSNVDTPNVGHSNFIIIDEDGSLYFTDPDANKITKIAKNVTGVIDSLNNTVNAQSTSSDNSVNIISPTILVKDSTNQTEISRVDIKEANASSTFEYKVSLGSEPSSNVLLSIVSASSSVATVSTSTLTFTPLNWNVAQSVTISGVYSSSTHALTNGIVQTDITVSVNNASTSDSLYTNNTQPKIINVSVSDIDDEDRDGVLSSIESSGFNGGDGNGDGTADRLQLNVAVSTNPVVQGGYATLVASPDCASISGFSVVSEASRSSQDSAFDYPVGMYDYTLQCTESEAVTTISIFYDRVYDTTNWVWRKYDIRNNTYSTIATTTPITIETAQVGTTTVTKASFSTGDWADLDEDGAETSIVNRVGPAIPFTQPVVVALATGGSGAVVSYGCSDPKATNYKGSVLHNASLCVYAAKETAATTTKAFSTSTKDVVTPTPQEEKKDTPTRITADTTFCEPVIKAQAAIVLGRNNNVDDVKRLESFLNQNEKEALTVNGVFEKEDAEAVKRFQQKYYNDIMLPSGGGAVTGTVGSFTRAKMQALNCANKNTACPYFSLNQKLGSSGEEVKKIQRFLNAAIGANLPESGYFGKQTEAAVKQYQNNNKAAILTSSNIKNASGFWFEKTRAVANNSLGCQE